jgi:hypothetical protein
VCFRGDNNSPGAASAPWITPTTSATTLQIAFGGTPVAGTSYVLICTVSGY